MISVVHKLLHFKAAEYPANDVMNLTLQKKKEKKEIQMKSGSTQTSIRNVKSKAAEALKIRTCLRNNR